MTFYILIFNLFLYLYFLKSYLKKNTFDVSAFIITIYGFIALMGVVLYTYPVSHRLFNDISLFHFIYLFVIFYLSIRPISKCRTITGSTIIAPPDFFFNLFIYLVGLITIVRLPSLVGNIKENLVYMITDTSFLSDRYQNIGGGGGGGFSSGQYNIISILGGMIDEIAIFLLMYYLTLPNKKKWIVVVLSFASILSPMGALTQGRRGSMAFAILNFLAFYLFFKDSFEKKLKSAIKTTIFVVVGFIVFGMSLITISRFTKTHMSDDYASYSIVYYLGQPMVYFSKACSTQPYYREGDRTIPLIKSFFVDGAYSYDSRMTKYFGMTVDESVFSTYYGEIILDYGHYIGFILLITFILILYGMGPHNKKRYPFYQVLPIVILIDLLVCGWSQSPFTDVGGNLHFVFIILMYIYFYIAHYSKKSKV